MGGIWLKRKEQGKGCDWMSQQSYPEREYPENLPDGIECGFGTKGCAGREMGTTDAS